MNKNKYKLKAWKDLDKLTPISIDARCRKLKEFTECLENISFNVNVWFNKKLYKDCGGSSFKDMNYKHKYNVLFICKYKDLLEHPMTKIIGRKLGRIKNYV